MFGTSGIRGVFGKEVTPELAFKVGAAIGQKGKPVVVGRDTRSTGEALMRALAAGAMSCGSDIIDIGIAPTPTLALASLKHKCSAAMITASHNPPEYNGIKLFSDGKEFTRAQEAEVTEKVQSGKFSRVAWNEAGKMSSEDALTAHKKLVHSLVDVALIRKTKPKVLIDAGNGAGSVLTPLVLREAGCEVIERDCEASGNFKRGLEPNAENLKETAKAVVAAGADLGIAHDGDADRAIVIDEKGRLLGLDAQLVLMIQKELEKKKGSIVSTVEASLAVREAVESAGSNIYITPVGSLFVEQEVAKRKAVFGGEPCGEYIFPVGIPAPDGILAALKFVELFCEKGKLSKLASGVRTYPMRRAKYPCADKEKAMAKIRTSAGFGVAPNTSDGLRFDMSDGWLLIRASGTEPIIRLTCEAKTGARLKELSSKAEDIIKKATEN